MLGPAFNTVGGVVEKEKEGKKKCVYVCVFFYHCCYVLVFWLNFKMYLNNDFWGV